MMVTTEPGCYSTPLVSVNVALAFIDAVIALVAFYQLMRIHSRNPQRGWTRQKVRYVLVSKMRKVRSERTSSEMWKVAGLAIVSVICSSVPSAFVLWIMRELPPSMTISVPGETRTLAFVSEYPTTTPPQHWTTIATAQNQDNLTKFLQTLQASRASPI
nr:hypothetical protein [Tanacetum cinerariifolium]